MGRIAVFASGNPGKLRELRALLPDWNIVALGDVQMPEETGRSFYENAAAKARFARTLEPGCWAIGEDSGLEVEGLGGAPGIRSARYAGESAGDEENVAKLLAAMAEMEGEQRRARYVSELVVLDPDGSELRGTGTLAGMIAAEPRGSAGFGYDPVFVPAGENGTVAELGDEWKRAHSHRAAATGDLLARIGEPPQEVEIPRVLFPHDTKADALSGTPLFKDLSRHELVELAKVTEDLEVDEGKVLMRDGDLGREFFVIVDGEVSVTKDGKEIRRLGPGDFFGEIALVYENARRTATVTADSPLRFFVLTRQSFRSLLEHQPEIEDKVMAALEERLRSDAPA